jgi:uncharacterized protein (TIGR02757 family)
LDQQCNIRELAPVFEKIYQQFNKRRYVHPDPLEFLYNYKTVRDREIAGLIASSLAYGRVQQILKSVSRILDPMGASPFEFLMGSDMPEVMSLYSDFKHRFTTGSEVVHLLKGLKLLLCDFGSIENFLCLKRGDEKTLIKPLDDLVNFLEEKGGLEKSSLLSRPSRGSACKRHLLFLKWMTRKDEVDPGGWDRITPDKLIMPVDTHIFSIACKLGMTRRKQANLKTAVEITESFRSITPMDPTKYDFVLTRFGIRAEMDKSDLFMRCFAQEL